MGKIHKWSSSFARLRTPVKKPGRSKIQNFLMDCKIPNFIVKKHYATGYDSGCGYGGVGKLRDPEFRKDGHSSTKVGLMRRGACHTFPSFDQVFNVDVLYRIRGFPWRPNSEFRRTCFSISLSVLCFFFISVTTHCRQQCPSCTRCQECKA